MLSILLALNAGLVAGHSLSLGDAVSAVQGLVHAHQHAGGQFEPRATLCAENPLSEEEEEQQPLGQSLADEVEVVVVRGAGEDVRWLDAIPEIPAVLYDRIGLSELLPKARKNLRIVAQDNTGREDDAMLRHIIDNYDSLPEFTLFLQGWPFWPCAGALEMVRRVLRNVRQPADPDFIQNGAQPGLVPLAGSFYQYDVSDGKMGHWGNLAMTRRRVTGESPQANRVAARSSYNDTCAEILGRPCPNQHWVAQGSQWAVSRDRIRANPLALYRKLLDMSPPGLDIHRARLRGLVLEAAWPMLWGAPDWSPGAAAEAAVKGGGSGALKRASSAGNYCVFSTDKGAYPTAGERRGVCELERRAGGGYAELSAEEAREPVAQLRAIQGHRITKAAVETGSSFAQAPRPRKTYTSADAAPFCQKRHIWSVSTVTHLRNKQSDKCIERKATGFAMSACKEQEASQQMRLSSKANSGSYQIQDLNESACFDHNFSAAAPTQCKQRIEGGSVDSQKWDVVKQGAGGYQVRVKGAPVCLIHGAGLQTGACEGEAALWEFSDAEGMGQYWKNFDFALTQFSDGRLALRCTMRLHSSRDQAELDLVEPEWRRRGRVVDFRLVEAQDGAHFLAQRLPSGADRYISCDQSTNEARFGKARAPWRIRPVSNGFVFLESDQGALSFIVDGGKMRCSPMMEDGAPPDGSTFALEFPKATSRKI